MAVQPVGSRLHYRVQHRAAATAEFGAKAAGLHVELLNGIDGRLHRIRRAIQKIHRVVVMVDAIENIVVIDTRYAVGDKAAACKQPARFRRRGCNSRTELRQ